MGSDFDWASRTGSSLTTGSDTGSGAGVGWWGGMQASLKESFTHHSQDKMECKRWKLGTQDYTEVMLIWKANKDSLPLGRTHPLCPKPRIKIDCYSCRCNYCNLFLTLEHNGCFSEMRPPRWHTRMTNATSGGQNRRNETQLYSC